MNYDCSSGGLYKDWVAAAWDEKGSFSDCSKVEVPVLEKMVGTFI